MISERLCRMLARAGWCILRRPPEAVCQLEGSEDLMLYHYCPACRVYRYDKLIDYLSKNSHFVCGTCGRQTKTIDIYGQTLFLIQECCRIARERLRAKGIKDSFFRFYLLLLWYRVVGINKYLPPDRGGKTAAELETEAGGRFLFTVSAMHQTFADLDQLRDRDPL